MQTAKDVTGKDLETNNPGKQTIQTNKPDIEFTDEIVLLKMRNSSSENSEKKSAPVLSRNPSCRENSNETRREKIHGPEKEDAIPIVTLDSAPGLRFLSLLECQIRLPARLRRWHLHSSTLPTRDFPFFFARSPAHGRVRSSLAIASSARSARTLIPPERHFRRPIEQPLQRFFLQTHSSQLHRL